MIERFLLSDYLSFESAELNFGKGLIVFTGPSGSGKSILMQALLASLGLHDAQAALSESTVATPLDLSELGFDDEDIAVFRQIKKEKVRYFLNNQSISKKGLHSVSRSFVRHLSLKDYSDFENSSLLELLDAHVALSEAKHQEKIQEFSEKFTHLQKIQTQLNEILEQERKIVELKEFAAFEIEKINEINPSSGEDEELLVVKKRLSHREKIEESLQKAEAIFEHEYSVGEALIALDIESDFFDDAMNEVRAHFEDARASLDELDDIDVEQVLDRIEQLSDLKRRYGSIEEALEYKKKKELELQEYESLDENKEHLIKEVDTLSKELDKSAKSISKSRSKAASELQVSINELARELYLESVTLDVENVAMNKHGIDKVNVLLKGTNLDNVSSGEFNRLRLALLAQKSSLLTREGGVLFLDEIDANLSGEESMSVAKVLTLLSKNYQIFSISHQPQLTSQAHQHFLVTREGKSSVIELEHNDRINEIARMVSGEKITDEALRFAKALLR